MKQTNNDDLNSKILKERYARILGLEIDIPVQKEKTKSPVRWFVWAGMGPAMVLAGWFIAMLITESFDRLAPGPQQSGTQQIPPASPEAAGMTGADSTRPEPQHSAQVNTEDKVQDSVGPESSMSSQLNEPSPQDKMIPTPVVPDTFFIVLLSTQSKEEAIQRAKELSGKGIPSEVILSSTGYYGVVQRQDSYEKAQAALQSLTASVAVKEKPYLMASDRVEERIDLPVK